MAHSHTPNAALISGSCAILAAAAVALISGCSGDGDALSPPTMLSITTTSLPSGQVGTPYSATLAAPGGTPPYQWSVSSGALPPGLTLAAATGVISGTPTTAENAEALTVQVTDSGNPRQSSSQSLSMTINATTLRVATTSLPSGQVGIHYSATLAATGGTPPYQWSVSSGALPTGLTLAAATGVISGTPTTAENAEALTVQVMDSGTPRQSSSQSLHLTINSPSSQTLRVTTTSLPSGQVSTAYSATLAASGGTPPYQWSVSSGALPPGLTLASSTGVISGTPTTAENAEAVTIQVSDSGTPRQSSSQSLSVTINATTLRVATTSLPSGQVSTAYSTTLAASGGTPPYQWSVSSGALPPGLTLAAATGVISGTPTTPENAKAVIIQVSDSGTPRQSSSQSLSVTISATTLRVATTSLPSGQVSTAYSATLAASGGTPPYQWSISSGALPPGLTLAAATGVISGTPTTPENAKAVIIQVSDSGTPRQSSSQSLSLTINATTLRVATTSLPSGQVSTAYSTTLAASGGTPPYQWSVSSGALPPGLTLAAGTGVISGTPTTVENAEVLTVQVTDSGTPRQSSSQSLSVTISATTLRVATTSLPSGQVGTAYSTTLAASGGTPPYQWSVSSGALPPGLTLAAATGVISGTPTTVENAESLTVQVTDSGTPRQSSSQSLSLTINSISSTTLRITTTSLPSGQVGTAYSTTLAASGGTPPYQWSVSSGALPPGLTLAAATGVISGTPTTVENAEALTIRVTDAGTPRQSSSRSLSLTINSTSSTTLRITTTSLPSGQVSTAYSTTLAASGGTPPYQWSVSSGALPPGLTLAAATGVISGTPTTVENAEAVTVQVTDSGTPRQSSSQSLSATINATTLRVTTTSLPSGQVGTAYSTTLAASGGTPPYQWSVSSGVLPPGLTLAAATGVISGTPTTAENAEAVAIQVTDSGTPRQSSSQSLSATINATTLRVTTTSLPSGQVGTAYSTTLAASGGTPPYQWSVSSGVLPPGLTLAAATGVISGTPTTVENAEALTVQVTDSGTPRQSSSQSLSVTISATTLRVATTSLPSGQVSTAYSTTLAASGGTPPYQWSVSSGALPPGLTLAASTGVISGTPTTAENAEAVTVQVTDAGTPRQSSSQSLSVTINATTLRVATTSLPSGQVGTAYSTTLAASGGTPPYQWSVSSGVLPPGLTLAAATGVISGTPTTAENAEAVAIQVTDSGTPRQSSSQSLSATINATTLRVTTTSLPSGQVGTAYSTTLAASGGTPPYQWSVSSGVLPPGLTLAAATGVISGTPTTAENAEAVAIQVTDSGTPRQSSSQSLSATINATTLRVTTTSLPSGQVGTAYSTTLAASGGTPPYQWSVSSGVLPPGLTLAAATGVISGTPTTAENAEAVAIQVTDSGTPRQSSSQSLSVTINATTLRVATTSLPSGQVGTAYSTTLAASGGTPPYQWSVSSGVLPPGLTLAAATGVISGTPTTVENAEALTVQVTDSGTPRQSSSQSLSVTINATTLRVTTTSLPSGQVGTAYSTTLAASGGTPPYQWSVSSGTLPMGLTLAASTGVISGTPAAAASATPVTFKVTDSGTPAQIAYAPLTLTVSSGSITISISPASAALTVTQIATLVATTNDSAGVKWSISPSGGSLSATQSLSGVPITLTAPSTAGVYSLTATSVTDPTEAVSIPVAVTGLPGVLTYHNDLARDGVNAQEYALTPSNVATGFGKIFSCTVDGAVYSQPLWIANLTVGGAQHNVVFVATAHDSLFAFDADASPCVKLWQVSLIDAAHGATAGETTVPSGTSGNLVGIGFGDIAPEVGVIGTPVIDSASGILYVVSKSTAAVSGTPQFYQRLHAIDVTTGLEKASSPVLIQGTYPGSGDGASTDTWNARYQNQRAGLAFVNGTVYIAWASHEDNPPFYGWVIGYRYGTSGFTQTAVLNVTPNVKYGGIWMSGAAPAADGIGNLYLITGNGGFDVTNTSAPNNDYGDSFLELSINPNAASPQSAFSVPQWFTPSDQQTDDTEDQDFGAGGAAVLADVIAGNPPVTTHLVVGGGKDGNLYVLNRDRMGGYGDVNAWEEISTGNSLYSTAAFWNNTIYLAPTYAPLTSYVLSTASTPVEFKLEYLATSPSGGYGRPGATPAVSASDSTNAIIWALDANLYCTNQSNGCGPAVLHAYDPANQLNEIWNSSLATGGADAAGNAVKFTVPTIANGKVYVGTRGNNTGGATASTTVPGELDVYGLKSN